MQRFTEEHLAAVFLNHRKAISTTDTSRDRQTTHNVVMRLAHTSKLSSPSLFYSNSVILTLLQWLVIYYASGR